MMLSDVCLSVAYIGPKSRTERPRKTKIGTEVAHVTRDSDMHVRRPSSLNAPYPNNNDDTLSCSNGRRYIQYAAYAGRQAKHRQTSGVALNPLAPAARHHHNAENSIKIRSSYFPLTVSIFPRTPFKH